MPDRREFFRSLLNGAAGSAVAASRAHAQANPFLRYPYLQNVSETAATVVWTTEATGPGEIRFGPTRELTTRTASVVRLQTPAETHQSKAFHRHAATLTGLQADTTYFYAVFVDGVNLTAGSELSFRTANRGPFRFLAFGDSGSSSAVQKLLAEHMLADRPALVTHLGDLAYPDGTFDEFDRHYFGVYRELMKQVPFFPCIGNHEMPRDAFPYLSVHELPSPGVAPLQEKGRYYSFNWGNAHFVSLDTNTTLERAVVGGSPMLEWLDRDLEATNRYWKIVFFHHPPFASGPNSADPLSVLARSAIVPILEKHGVHLVLNGHEHSYQRTPPLRQGRVVSAAEGIVYATSGAAGHSLYPVHDSPLVAFGKTDFCYLRLDVTGGEIVGRAIGLHQVVLDEWRLRAVPRITAVVNAATGRKRFGPGSLVSIYGRNLVPYSEAVRIAPRPDRHSGVRVLTEKGPVPLTYVSPRQINAQLPYCTPGDTELVVSSAAGESREMVQVEIAAPGIFHVAHADGSLVSSESPAQPGESLVVYAAGLGPVHPGLEAGTEPAAGADHSTELPVMVEYAGRRIEPMFARLVAGMPGVYQVGFRLPEEVTTGPLALRAGEILSPAVELVVSGMTAA